MLVEENLPKVKVGVQKFWSTWSGNRSQKCFEFV